MQVVEFFFKALYDVLREINWLKDKVSTKFIKWAKCQGLASFRGKDFTHVNQSSVDNIADKIKKSFVEIKDDGTITDIDAFIEEDPIGNKLKKINE